MPPRAPIYWRALQEIFDRILTYLPSSLETLVIRVKPQPCHCTNYIFLYKVWPCNLQRQDLKIFELGGAVIMGPVGHHDLHGRKHPGNYVEQEYLTIMNDFFAPNLEEFRYTPDLIALGGFQPRKYLKYQFPIKDAMYTFLRYASELRPTLKVVLVPSCLWNQVSNGSGFVDE